MNHQQEQQQQQLAITPQENDIFMGRCVRPCPGRVAMHRLIQQEYLPLYEHVMVRDNTRFKKLLFFEIYNRIRQEMGSRFVKQVRGESNNGSNSSIGNGNGNGTTSTTSSSYFVEVPMRVALKLVGQVMREIRHCHRKKLQRKVEARQGARQERHRRRQQQQQQQQNTNKNNNNNISKSNDNNATAAQAVEG